MAQEFYLLCKQNAQYNWWVPTHLSEFYNETIKLNIKQTYKAADYLQSSPILFCAIVINIIYWVRSIK